MIERPQQALAGSRPGSHRWQAPCAVLLAVSVAAALTWFAFNHLPRMSFWFDESVQFWMSRGLDAYGDPFTPARPKFRAINAENGRGNLDPGGFTLVLGAWMAFSTNEAWLRTLPFLYFIAGMIGLGCLGWLWRRSIPFAIFSAAIPAAFPILLNYSIEVRAYSMEFAGITIGCLLLALLIQQPTIRLALISGTVFGLFLTSRYSYALFVAAAVIGLTVALPKRIPESRLAAWKPLLAFLAPLAMLSIGILFVLVIRQYNDRISYQGGAMLEYLRGMTAQGKTFGELAKVAAYNLTHLASLPLTLMACVGIYAALPGKWRERWGGGSISARTTLFGVLALAALIINALVWRWHPWAIGGKYSMWLHALSAVAIVFFLASILERWAAPPVAGWETKGWIAAALVVGLIVMDFRLATYRRIDEAAVVPALAYLEKINPPAGSIAVQFYWYPTVRQFYEYGRFAGSPLYPKAFRLPSWTGPKPLIDSQTRWLITYQRIDHAQAEFPQAKIVHDPALPKQLYRVEPLPGKASDEPR
jgi:hypothetical protein